MGRWVLEVCGIVGHQKDLSGDWSNYARADASWSSLHWAKHGQRPLGTYYSGKNISRCLLELITVGRTWVNASWNSSKWAELWQMPLGKHLGGQNMGRCLVELITVCEHEKMPLGTHHSGQNFGRCLLERITVGRAEAEHGKMPYKSPLSEHTEVKCSCLT